jgi:hypothetical protein
MTSGERLDQLVATVALAPLEEWLVRASAQELVEARSWHATARLDLRRLHAYGGEIWNNLSEDRRSDLPWVRALLAAGIEGPVAAARLVPWDQFNHRVSAHGKERFLRVVASRGKEWVRAFVPAAAAVRDANANVRALFQTLCPLVEDFGLPVPDGTPFWEGWLRTIWTGDVDSTTDLLVNDPMAPELFFRLMSSRLLGQEPAVLGVAARLVKKGLLDRPRVVSQVFDALTIQQAVGVQRELARLLSLLHVTKADIPGGLPFAQGLVATCHGSVGSALLPLVLPLIEAPDELAQLCGTIAGRPERAQKQTMLRALAEDALQARVGREAVHASLAMFRESSDDQKLLSQVDALSAMLGQTAPAVAEPDPEPTGLWDLAPPGERFVSPRVGEWPGMDRNVRRGLEHELRDGSTYSGPQAGVHSDLYLAAIVRQANTSGAPVVRSAIEQIVGQVGGHRGVLGEALVDWVADPGLESYRAARHMAGERRLAGGYLACPYSLNVPADAFRYLLARESLLRLGRSARLLSTPSHADHSVSFRALVERIALCQGSSVGPMDLLQALLRLRPSDPSELHQLDGMDLPVDDSVSPTGEPTGIPDGVELLREYVLAGGLPPLEPYVQEVSAPFGQARWVSDTALPLPVGLLALAPGGFLNDHPERYRSDEVVRIVPQWPDRLLWHDTALEGPCHMTRYNLREMTLGREAPPDLPTYDAVLHQMVCTDGTSRAAAARIGLDLMSEGRFDADRLAQVAVARLQAGVLPLARVTAVWELMTTSGGLRELWPAMIRVAEAACSAHPRPAGTADLLRTMSALLPEVPAPEVPPAIRAYAESKGSTKAHHETRRFVTTADRRSAR